MNHTETEIQIRDKCVLNTELICVNEISDVFLQEIIHPTVKMFLMQIFQLKKDQKIYKKTQPCVVLW